MELLFLLCFLIGPISYFANQLLGVVGGIDDADLENIGDADFDAEADFEMEADLEAEFDGVDLNYGEDGHESANAGVESSGYNLNFFSPKLISTCISGFGAGGYIAMDLFKMNEGSSLVAASIFGAAAYLIVFGFLSFFFSRTTYASPRPRMTGQSGFVVIGIPKDGLGIIEVLVNRERQRYKARSHNNRAIATGKRIEILSITPNSRVMVVKKKTA